MAQMAQTTDIAQVPKNFRTVITAAAAGNVIEWYDFYIFGSLATILAVKFFEKSHPVAALLSTIALFTAGFLVRPLGAFLFGWLGDRVGRKYTFIMTLAGMALGTGAIGLIPTFESIGLAAAFILFGLRMIQGLCLGGSYGGAITYVAEHVSDERRGYYTGWLQTSPTLGIVLSLVVIIVTRTYAGEAVFNAWAWRIPFLFSFLLVFVTLYMRANFEESPVYAEIKAKGMTSKNPWREAFLNPANLKYVVIATIVVLGEGVVWYSSQFWALYFLQTVAKVDTLTTAYIVGARADHWHPDTHLVRLAVRHHRPQTGDIRGLLPRGGHLLSAVCRGSGRSRSRAISTCRLRSSSSPFSSPMSGWSTGRSAPSSLNFSPAGSATRRYPCRIMIGNGWGGGLVPFITTAAYTATGSIAYALIYPIAVPAICLVLSLFLMPETRKMKIWGPQAA